VRQGAPPSLAVWRMYIADAESRLNHRAQVVVGGALDCWRGRVVVVLIGAQPNTSAAMILFFATVSASFTANGAFNTLLSHFKQYNDMVMLVVVVAVVVVV